MKKRQTRKTVKVVIGKGGGSFSNVYLAVSTTPS